MSSEGVSSSEDYEDTIRILLEGALDSDSDDGGAMDWQTRALVAEQRVMELTEELGVLKKSEPKRNTTVLPPT